MTLTEFAKEHEVSIASVSNYVKRHETELQGHTYRQGKSLNLDNKAYEILHNHYKTKNTTFITDPLQQLEIDRLNEELNKAKTEIKHLTQLNTKLETNNQALTNSNQALTTNLTLTTQLLESNQKAQTQLLESQTELSKQNQELQAELLALKSRSFLARLFNK